MAKYKIGDKVWKAELKDSFQREIFGVKEFYGRTLYNINASGVPSLWCGEIILFGTKEECEKHRLETFGKYLESKEDQL